MLKFESRDAPRDVCGGVELGQLHLGGVFWWTGKSCCFGLLRPLGQRLTVTASPNISYSHAGNFFTIFHPTRPASTLTYYILVPKPLRDTRPLEEPVFRNFEILRYNLRIFHVAVIAASALPAASTSLEYPPSISRC